MEGKAGWTEDGWEARVHQVDGWTAGLCGWIDVYMEGWKTRSMNGRGAVDGRGAMDGRGARQHEWMAALHCRNLRDGQLVVGQ